MCEVCSDFSQLLQTCEARLSEDVPALQKSDLEIVLNYILAWHQRQCMCCYRDIKNFERFFLLVQTIVCLTVCQLKLTRDDLIKNKEKRKSGIQDGQIKVETSPKSPSSTSEPKRDLDQTKQKHDQTDADIIVRQNNDELWTLQEREKLMHITSKIFLLNFPLYFACKHSGLSRLDDLSGQEISNLSCYCDLHDMEIPAYLFRNVSLFCKSNAMCVLMEIFENGKLETVPLSFAHALVGVVGNIKLWLNYRAITQLFMPIRMNVLRYLCGLDDKELRLPAIKTMADFFWSAAKEPIDTPTLAFDIDGLELAFKYFNSSTLTMRLAGVTQINANIATYNELCSGEVTPEIEVAGQQLAQWLIKNNIIDHLFGPNLHVEVIKQSQMILKFLAMEGRITTENIDLMWQAAQLKHCGRQVYDLLPGFIRALSPKPCTHLYNLLCSLPPKEHSEQSLYLASALLRVMWSRGSLPTSSDIPTVQPTCKPHRNSSSEASVSMDQTNSDEDPCEEMSTSNEETGPTPRKQTKQAIVNREWLGESNELLKKNSLIKSCQKRSKATSGSASSANSELRQPRKKKLYKKREQRKPTSFLATDVIKSDLGDMVESVSDGESSGSDHDVGLSVGAAAVLLDDDGSVSSGLSDTHPTSRYDRDDDSVCEEELARLASQAACINEYSIERRPHSPVEAPPVCEPGNTLLWDLLQDDRIDQLGEGLALEAEKALCALLCFSTDKFIRIKFIEGCLDNLANHRSVAVSLRLLPKLFSSFQQLRGMDMHQVVLWAERERGMMRLFMEDFRVYASKCSGPTTQERLTEVTVRLQFLTTIFSRPDHFKLSVDQIEQLWWCAHKCGCEDCLYSWLLSHTKCGDRHALPITALTHLYLHKMPTLNPQSISLMGLSLYQQLCNLARMALGGDGHHHSVAIDHLWKIALRANSTDVSMGAIQYLNSYYMGQQLQQEEDFVSQCMTHLASATARLGDKYTDVTTPPQVDDDEKSNIYECMNEEAALQCIQRALLLLRTHLDTFKRRYAYHLRRWAIAEWESGWAGRGPLKITLQPAGAGPKATIRLHATDLVAHLRAHVHLWWKDQMTSEETMTALGDGPLRMITQGQELTMDFDERTLYDMGFKENQLVFVSVGVGGSRTAWAEWPSSQPAPSKSSLPTMLLLEPTYFTQLEELMCTLGRMKDTNNSESVHIKAQLLSRRVWDILQAVPLNPTLLESFQNPNETDLPKLLDPSSPQKLMYSLHIVDKLSSTGSALSKDTAGTSSSDQGKQDSGENWSELFINRGGLRHLYEILMSGDLQRRDDSEWRQDCLALLLQLICRIGTLPNSDPAQAPHLHESFEALMNNDEMIDRLISILCDVATAKEPSAYKTGFWGRAQVVCHCLRVCAWWGRGSRAASLAWRLRDAAPRLLLDDGEPAVRRETAALLSRACCPSRTAAAALLHHLLQHLPRAIDIAPQPHILTQHHPEEGKEPYGPACRDYFWLVCRLVDSLPEEYFKEESSTVEALCIQLCGSLRDAGELTDSPDDSLCGQLTLLTHLLKHPLPFKTSHAGRDLLHMVFGFLFDVANPENRKLPKCKSQKSRAAAYDLLVEMVKGAPDNYMLLYDKLMEHHKPGRAWTSAWDYWPGEESRAQCGRVGLSNLGATCYLAAAVQHLYMLPPARRAVLEADPNKSRHSAALHQLQRMFAFLAESERKAYNPRDFCKVYQMDHQPLNTGEQKDMAEFFIDLVSKLEEMTPELKTLVKNLFCGVLSNNVVSLDCGHVSRTLEEFYTVRCQVADMRNLQQSLDEVTVKDTLEGDNKYTCDRCNNKVRAEKRACFKKLPHVLCFNTMRYTFNMVTMLKEKVNTHFSFPMRLDMSGYVEKHLMPSQYKEEKRKSKEGEGDADTIDIEENYEYELIGVTVHTGTADGGHYYSFIRDREHEADRWLLFNDSEVKPFDPAQIAAECFGGEMTSKTYDSVTDKFMDFSFEKTNSAYMLFYELCPSHSRTCEDAAQTSSSEETLKEEKQKCEVEPIKLPPDLQKWIWDDNMQFLHERNIFQHAYFTFMGQMCSYVPQSLMTLQSGITEVAARLSTSFFIETFIHAKEKPTMVSWVELVTKQFNASSAASEWFLGYMADDPWWPMQVLIKCPNQMVRQMFQRLCMHVIQRLRTSHCALYLQSKEDTSTGDDSIDIGEPSCVTRFIRMLLSLMENGARSHMRLLTEYFSLLYEFTKMGEEESKFMLHINAITAMVNFYLGHTAGSSNGTWSSDEGGGSDRLRPGALDKMIALVAALVERSRGLSTALTLSTRDSNSLLSDINFPFIYQQTRDCLNLQQTKLLVFALSRWNETVAQQIVDMLFQAINKHPDNCGSFFKLLSLLVEGSGGSSAAGGVPCFMSLVLPRIWDAAEACPHAALEWLAMQVPRCPAAASHALRTSGRWVERLLVAAGAARVRAAAALLLVALVPSAHFRQGYARARQPHRLPPDAHLALHQVFTMLLEKLKVVRKYTDIATHGTMKLTAYFGVMSYCVVSTVEKLMFGPYFHDLWDLYHPAISEPSAAIHPNKQALLAFWYAVSQDCPENIQVAIQHQALCKHIAFNYILADHEDGEVISYNRAMLPPYYALLRLFAQRSHTFAKSLIQHQNIHWAFRNIAPHAHLYPAAADELLRLAKVLISRQANSSPAVSGSSNNTELESREIAAFRRSTLSAYLQGLNGRTCWTTLLTVFRTLVDNDDDRLYVVYNGGLQMAFEALHGLHGAYSETERSWRAVRACVRICRRLCAALRVGRDTSDARAALLACKDWPDTARRLLALLHAPPHLSRPASKLLKELIQIGGGNVVGGVVSLLLHAHAAARTHTHKQKKAFPKLGEGVGVGSSGSSVVRAAWRVALCGGALSEQLVLLAAAHRPVRLAALWNDVVAHQLECKYEDMFTECSVVAEYIESVLLEDRQALCNDELYQFCLHFFPKVSVCKVGTVCGAVVGSIESASAIGGVNTGDVRALHVLVKSCASHSQRLITLARSLADMQIHTPALEETEPKESTKDQPTHQKSGELGECSGDDENSDNESSEESDSDGVSDESNSVHTMSKLNEATLALMNSLPDPKTQPTADTT